MIKSPKTINDNGPIIAYYISYKYYDYLFYYFKFIGFPLYRQDSNLEAFSYSTV